MNKSSLLIALLPLILMTSLCAAEAPYQPPTVTAEALDIHHSAFLIDGHNDLPWEIRNKAGGTFENVDIAKSQPQFHTDIPRLRQGGLKGQFWSVYVPAETTLTGDALLKTLEQIAIVRRMMSQYPETFELVSTADDLERIARSGKVASMIGVEGGYSIEDSLENLNRYYKLGVRYMTLTHSKNLSWADSATDEEVMGGLSEFGEEVIREMNKLGMLVDLSHVSAKTMKHALRITKAPVIFSHSSARALTDHPRNVPDDVLKLLPENGGIVMVNFYSAYIAPTETLKQNPKALGTLADVCDHIEHIIKIAGIYHVGIGSDFDGVPRLPVGLEDVSTYPWITQELLNRGYGKEEIHQILGGNVLRVLRNAERVAKK
ncbi:MAG: dipeptidase [Planctomycetaceae bacterium]|jgi:membrane dipeptidase|nr:dipeptidase [Planctomycetaceae bacterium]